MTNHIIQLKLKEICFKMEGEKMEEILQEMDQARLGPEASNSELGNDCA